MNAATLPAAPYWDRPMAAKGLQSYRYALPYGAPFTGERNRFVMIGARDDADALNEAKRSYDKATREGLQVWNGESYANLGAAPTLAKLPHFQRYQFEETFREAHAAEIAAATADKPEAREALNLTFQSARVSSRSGRCVGMD